MATAEFYCSFARTKFTRRCCVTRKTANDFDPVVLKLFDLYVHGLTSRRGFLDGVAKFTAGGAAAAGLLEALNPRFAEAEQIAKDDPRITASYVEYQSPDGYGTLRAYLAKPAHVEGKLPAVLVVHENRGLNPHIEDISRRLAVDHFIAFAPDALSPLGGYPGDEDKARDLFPKLDQAKTRNDFIAAYNVVKSLPESNGKVGVVGFCYGGGIANFLATRLPDLAAAVPFYGAQPTAPTIASMLDGRPTRQPSRPMASTTRPLSIQVFSMGSTTIPRPAMTQTPRSWPGNAPSNSSMLIWGTAEADIARPSFITQSQHNR
jgi:carboxymethylenebutenolidase